MPLALDVAMAMRYSAESFVAPSQPTTTRVPMADTPKPTINYAQLATSLLKIFRNHSKDLRIRLNGQIEHDVGACLSLEVFSLATKGTVCQVATEFPLPQDTYIHIDASKLTTGDYEDAGRCLNKEYNDLLMAMPFRFEPPSPADLEFALLGLPAAKVKTCHFALTIKLGRFHSATEECILGTIYPAAVLDQLIDDCTEDPNKIHFRRFFP